MHLTHIILTSWSAVDTKLDPYCVKKLLSWDSHTDVRRTDPCKSAVSYVLKFCQNPNCDWMLSDNLLSMRKAAVSLNQFKEQSESYAGIAAH